jgi:hypothetical protein
MSRIQRRAVEAEVVIALLAEAYPKCFAVRECRRCVDGCLLRAKTSAKYRQ